MNEFDDRIRLHSAGATILHESFDDLISYKNDFELNQELIQNFVLPFYMEIGNNNEPDFF